MSHLVSPAPVPTSQPCTQPSLSWSIRVMLVELNSAEIKITDELATSLSGIFTLTEAFFKASLPGVALKQGKIKDGIYFPGLVAQCVAANRLTMGLPPAFFFQVVNTEELEKGQVTTAKQ
jgi:hypothetical protein